jgi:hypothetical protein
LRGEGAGDEGRRGRWKRDGFLWFRVWLQKEGIVCGWKRERRLGKRWGELERLVFFGQRARERREEDGGRQGKMWGKKEGWGRRPPRERRKGWLRRPL